jgi:ABC-2 type transport system permease protein
MLSFNAALRNELIKLYYKKKTVVFMAFSALLPIIAALLIGKLQGIIGISTTNEGFAINVLDIFTLFVLPLFIFLLASDLFPGEISSHNMKLTLLRPVSRFKVFLAKTAALGLCIALTLAIIGIINIICGAVFTDIQMVGGWFNIIKAYIAAFFSMFTIGIAAIFISQFFNRSSSALIFLIIVFAAAKLLPVFFHSATYFSLAAYTDWHLLWVGHAVSVKARLTSFMFLLSSAVLLFSLGYYIFDKKEF